jgi:uncharacterized damage-inducible protein DinB
MFLNPDDDPRSDGGFDDERTILVEYLRDQRLTLELKCSGLDADELARRSVPPSSMSLLGLVRHMSDVERVWFRRRIAAEPIEALYWSDASPDGDFDDLDPAGAEADFATYAAEVEVARDVLAARGYDDTFVARRSDGSEETIDIRTLVLHMIEEYARHNGHADLLREAIDGAVGE